MDESSDEIPYKGRTRADEANVRRVFVAHKHCAQMSAVALKYLRPVSAVQLVARKGVNSLLELCIFAPSAPKASIHSQLWLAHRVFKLSLGCCASRRGTSWEIRKYVCKTSSSIAWSATEMAFIIQ